MDAAIQYILYFAVLVVLAVPLGRFMAHIMDGEHTFLSPVIAPVERGVYRLLRIDAAEQMGCRRYLASVLVFSGIGLVALVALQALQSFLARQSPAPAGCVIGPVVQHGCFLHNQHQLAILFR